MQKKQTDYVRFALRINPELHERLVEFSTKNNYSLNSSINTAIDAGLEQLDPLDDKNFQAPTIAHMKKQLPIRTQIRLPQELHAELVEEATANEASLNDVMVYYLANRKLSEDIKSAEAVNSKLPTIKLSAITPLIKNLLEEHAQRNKRSVDDEVAARLAKSFTIYGGQEALANATTEDLLRELSLRMKGMTVNISPVNDDV